MKKLFVTALALLLLCCAAAGLAEGETVVFTSERGGSIQVSRDAEAIDLGNVVLNRQGNDFNNLVAFINQLPNLKKLDMYNSEVYATQVEMLASACPQVEFGWTMLIPCDNPVHPERTPHRVRTDQTAFSTLHNSQCKLHTTWDLNILRFCHNMEALDIGHNAVDNLNFLYEMPHLKFLIVGKNSLTDITPLGSLKELQYLELFSNKVSDITPLAGCVSLVDLNMANNSVRDYSPLTGLTSLRRLFVYNSSMGTNNAPIDNGTVGMLRASLPQCRIDNATGGAHSAWRDHYRYKTILEMFWEDGNRENPTTPKAFPYYIPFRDLN